MASFDFDFCFKHQYSILLILKLFIDFSTSMPFFVFIPKVVSTIIPLHFCSALIIPSS